MDINDIFYKALAGDQKAEKQLFEHLTESFRLFTQQRVWDKSKADEIAQNALMTIAGKYREIKVEKSFAAWAYKILENKMLDYIKSRDYKKNQPTSLIDDNYSYMSWKFNPTLKMKLIDCFKKISETNNRFARILNLKYHGFSTKEICRKLGITENALYVGVARARSMLKLCLESSDYEL